MSTLRRITLLILPLSVVVCFSSLLYDAKGDTLCGIATVAGGGNNLSALRYKAFSTFRAECRPKKAAWSYFVKATVPTTFTFLPQPFSVPLRLNFTVKTRADAWIALAKAKNKSSIFADINIGGNGNTRAAIRACDTWSCPERLVQYNEQGLVSSEESRPFWIEYKEGVVTVGKGGQKEGFMEWDAGMHHGQVPTQVHVGITSWGQNSGEWVFFQYCL